MGKFDVSKHFSGLEKNLRTSESDVENINKRVRVITSVLNKKYWDSESDTKHSKLVGSYGRGTAIHLSDIDLLYVMPDNQKQRFEKYIHNGQSALLQDVKEILRNKYKTSLIKADGQVIIIEFSDGIKFEILPSFLIEGTSKYQFADTNNGRDWKETDPNTEQANLTARNVNFKSIVKKFCRMQRAWNDENNIGLSGIAIDSLVYNFFSTWTENQTSYLYFDWLSRDFYLWLKEFIDKGMTLWSLNNGYTIDGLDIIVASKANTAYKRSKKAIELSDSNADSELEWMKIYGNKFPKFEDVKQENDIKMSTRILRESIGVADDTEEFVSDKSWYVGEYEEIPIHSEIEMNGFRKGRIKRFTKIIIKPNSKVHFYVDDRAGVQWFWKIRNVGALANQRNMIRGQIIKGSFKKTEPINFKGAHYVEVYGVVSNTVKYFGKIDVPLEAF